ncbi:alkaline phosphatase D family protein [Fulvivirgaceae bacterium BMA10]|uniref:Alkaline phosphatase D family protein n=1 Tax=Splendidivirga corallicola TaxID=3051826 RepID=A0ABT8KKY2_9BACT|nr:alkaline phosphatase D family protein [Fulvivirgaceae bacterium BMA10]
MFIQRSFLNPYYFLILTLSIIDTGLQAQDVFFTTGFKVSEVSDQEAIIWTRLCAQKEPNGIRHDRKEKVFRHPINFDENQPVEQMDGAVKGIEGYVRAILQHGSKKRISRWVRALKENDFTVQIPFKKLKANTNYQLILEAKLTSDGSVVSTSGSFRTAPGKKSAAPVHFTTSTCQYFWSYDDKERGFKTYDQMDSIHPDFFVQTGDYVYYDKPGPLAKTPEAARHKWHAMDSRLSLKDFYKRTPIYMVKDDHDLLSNDVHPKSKNYGDLSFDNDLKIWRENAAIKDKPYRTFRWGKDLQIWLVEGREYRDAGLPDNGDSQSILGAKQIAWLKSTIKASDATFKVLLSATPIVGPDRKNKKDNHANKTFEAEGTWLREYLSKEQNLFVICGDRHWQYVSQDDETGLMEFGSGPVSDAHVQGWKPNDKRPEHKYLGLIGGFLGVKVFRKSKRPTIAFTHYDVNGQVAHQEIFYQ